MTLGHLAAEARDTTPTLRCALQTSRRIEPPPRGHLTPQTPPRATSPRVCCRGRAPRHAHLGKQTPKRPVGSSNVGLKIEWATHSCLPCEMHPLPLLFPSPHPQQSPSAHGLAPSRGARACVSMCAYFFIFFFSRVTCLCCHQPLFW